MKHRRSVEFVVLVAGIAVLDKGHYETGVKISKEQMKTLNLRPHQQNPEWNYSLRPRIDPSTPPK